MLKIIAKGETGQVPVQVVFMPMEIPLYINGKKIGGIKVGPESTRLGVAMLEGEPLSVEVSGLAITVIGRQVLEIDGIKVLLNRTDWQTLAVRLIRGK